MALNSTKATLTSPMTSTFKSVPLWFWFFVSLCLTRLILAFASFDYHIDGDTTVTLLMANDWDHTPAKAFFWGQQYMGTYEIWLLAKLGKLLSLSPIPLWLATTLATLFYCAGATLVYAALLGYDADHGRNTWAQRGRFILAFLILGFSPPSLQKYSFGIGTGYSFLPLVSGLCIFLGFRLRQLRWWTILAAGVLLGLSIEINRLNLVPIAGLALCLALTSIKKNFRNGCVLALGMLGGAAVELTVIPLSALSIYGGGSNFSWSRSLSNFKATITQLGTYLGTLPYGVTETEHALWFSTGHNDSSLTLNVLSVAALIALVRFTWKPILSRRDYLPFTAICIVNLAILVFSSLSLDMYAARRYALPMTFPLAFLLIATPQFYLNRALIGLRVAALAVYLVFSLWFTTPLGHLQDSLPTFSSEHDCLVGHGGDLTAIMALNRILPKTVDVNWRLIGNYSQNLDLHDSAAIRAACQHIFLVDTRHIKEENFREYCPHRTLLRDVKPSGLRRYRYAVQFYACSD